MNSIIVNILTNLKRILKETECYTAQMLPSAITFITVASYRTRSISYVLYVAHVPHERVRKYV